MPGRDKTMPQTLTYVVEDIIDQSHFHKAVREITTTHTIQGGAFFTCDATSGSFTITLPAAGGTNLNRMITVKKTSATNTVTVEGDGSETIDGALNVALSTQYDSLTVVSDGDEWHIEKG